MKPSILGVGSASALGCGVGSLRAGLEGTAHPRIDNVEVATRSGVQVLPVYVANAEGLERFVPRRALRRLDEFTRMALLASFLALEDSGVSLEDTSRIGVVLGTAYGPMETTFRYQDTIIDDGDKGASPTLFANSVHNAPASSVSIFMKIEGPCLTLTNFELTTTEVLRTACAWLEQGTVDFVLAGVGDEYCSVLGYALGKLGAGGSERIDPFHVDQCSYLPAAGFVTLLLGGESVDGAYARIDKIVCERAAARLSDDVIRGHRALVLSANGDRSTGPAYQRARLGGAKIAAYAPLYGSLPVGLGFDVALAGVSCRAGRVYPLTGVETAASFPPLTQELPLQHGDRIGCLECSPHHATLVSLERL